MATQENGIPSNILSNLPTVKNIASSTNATPIVITTSTPHGLTTGDWDSINNHQVNTAANGTWPVAVLTNSTFQLVGSVGNGVGGATGTSQSLAVGPTFAIPADGVDNLAAASVNVPFDALADRTAFLAGNLGTAKFLGLFRDGVDTDSFTSWDSFTVAGMTNGIWNDLAGSTVFAPGGLNLQTGDIIDLSLTASYNLSQNTAVSFNGMSLFVSVTSPGTADSFFKVTASQVAATVSQLTSNECHPLHLTGLVTAPNSGQLKVKIRGWPVSKATLVVWSFIGSVNCVARCYRPTSMPQ